MGGYTVSVLIIYFAKYPLQTNLIWFTAAWLTQHAQRVVVCTQCKPRTWQHVETKWYSGLSLLVIIISRRGLNSCEFALAWCMNKQKFWLWHSQWEKKNFKKRLSLDGPTTGYKSTWSTITTDIKTMQNSFLASVTALTDLIMALYLDQCV